MVLNELKMLLQYEAFQSKYFVSWLKCKHLHAPDDLFTRCGHTFEGYMKKIAHFMLMALICHNIQLRVLFTEINATPPPPSHHNSSSSWTFQVQSVSSWAERLSAYYRTPIVCTVSNLSFFKHHSVPADSWIKTKAHFLLLLSHWWVSFSDLSSSFSPSPHALIRGKPSLGCSFPSLFPFCSFKG